MKTPLFVAIGRCLILAALGLLLPGCGLFMDSAHESIPTVYRDPGVANTPTDNGNPPYVLSPYYPTTGNAPYTP